MMIWFSNTYFLTPLQNYIVDLLIADRTIKILLTFSALSTTLKHCKFVCQDYIAVKEKNAKYLPHSAGRYAAKRFRKAQCPIVERLTNSLMMHGRNNGKKLMAVRIVKHAFEIIHLLTGENPLQVSFYPIDLYETLINIKWWNTQQFHISDTSSDCFVVIVILWTKNYF